MDQVNNGEKHIQMRHARPLTTFQEHLFEILLQAYGQDDGRNDCFLIDDKQKCSRNKEDDKEEATSEIKNINDSSMDILKESEAQRETVDIAVLEIDHSKTIAAHMRWIFPMVMLINITWLHLLENADNLSEVVQMIISIVKWSLILLLIGCCIYQGYLIIFDKQQNESSMDDEI